MVNQNKLLEKITYLALDCYQDFTLANRNLWVKLSNYCIIFLAKYWETKIARLTRAYKMARKDTPE
jgi:hypothetical protein